MKYFSALFGKHIIFSVFLLAISLDARSQNYEIDKTIITVEGSAREKPWSMKAHRAAGSADLVIHDEQLIEVRSLMFSMDVADLKSESPKMDRRAAKALKAYPYSRIQFLGKIMKVTRIGTNNYLLLVDGNLFIGGITQISSLSVIIEVKEDGTIVCSGSKALNLDDFNVSLTPAEQRIMRLGDKVQLRFEVTLRK